jgi:hypothetical protein
MTEKYGSGRFCSVACSQSRNHSIENRVNISESLKGRKLTEEEKIALLTRKKRTHRTKYEGPKLPELPKEKLASGFFSRTRMSYPEKFWKQVLDNNNIDYQHGFLV